MVFKKKLDNFIFIAPSKKNKKYDVYDAKTKDYITSFGGLHKDGTPYEQYFDKIGYYSEYNHLDKKRRTNYYKRHGKKAKLYSPKWFSHLFLWP
jgi:hypothetical protein